MTTPLQKALATTSSARKVITAEHIELAQAFVRGEVGITAVNKALNYPPKSPQGYITICRALRQDCYNKHGVLPDDNKQDC